MPDVMHKLKPLEEQCQRLEDMVEQLEQANRLLEAENERLDTQNRSLGEETHNFSKPAPIAFRKRRMRSETEISAVHDVLAEDVIIIDSSPITAKRNPHRKTFLDKSAKKKSIEKPIRENDRLADHVLADRYRNLEHSIAQLVKLHYASKTVRPIPKADGTMIVDFQIEFFHNLLNFKRKTRRLKTCSLVFKYFNDTIFVPNSTWSGERDVLIRDVASGLLEILRPLRYRGHQVRSGKVTQSTGEELRSYMINLCDEALDLAVTMRNLRA